LKDPQLVVDWLLLVFVVLFVIQHVEVMAFGLYGAAVRRDKNFGDGGG